MTTTSPQSAPLAQGTTGDHAGTDDTAGGGIERVQAFDGLFLRAEHLTRMQDYARELSRAMGVAVGPGVVHGFGVTLEDDHVLVDPGLAVSPSGRVLRSGRVMKLGFADLTPTGNTFWWVEVAGLDWEFGEEAVQGLVCDEPCGPGTTMRGTLAEGVQASLVQDARLGLAGIGSERKRNWLASRLFEDESALGGHWPGVPGVQLAGRSWDPLPVPGILGDGVRIAVLIPDDTSGWQLDEWAARRDRGDPSSLRGWQWRLSMRPWDVFVAQVLQFQAQLESRLTSTTGLAGLGYVNELITRVNEVRTKLDQVARVTKREASYDLERLVADVQRGGLGSRLRAGDVEASLPSIGIDELPPAGLLPVSQTGGGVGEEVTRLLGGVEAVRVRVCRGDVSDVGGFLERAQHRDRIPLTGGVQQPVDILVARRPGIEELDWVAFARGDTVECAVETDPEPTPTEEPVAVYVVDEGRDGQLFRRYQSYLKNPTGTPPGFPAAPELVLRFPERSWALPDDPEYPRLVEMVHQIEAGADVVVVAVVSEPSRRALGGVRAGLLAARVTEQQALSLDLRTIVRSGEEAIVVLNPIQIN
jgi:hypothetical protein